MQNKRTLAIIIITDIQINDILTGWFGNSLEHEVYQGFTAGQ